MNEIYKVFWGGDGFGDHLLSAWVVNILNFNNIPAVFQAPREIQNLVNCSDWEPCLSRRSLKPIKLNRTKRKNPNFTILTDLIDFFLSQADEKIPLGDIDIYNAPHPLRYKNKPHLKGYDISLVTETGPWTPYRNWPYFNDLKKLFIKNDISFIDLSREKIKGIDFLNYVTKSKVYLGLETGASHYAAPYIKKKGIIIQSGYCDFRYWAAHYDYEFLHYPVNCSPCWKRTDCGHDHICMTHISATDVYNKVISKIYDK